MPTGLETVLSTSDPGDDTQLRFRYQHGYGVMLLVGSATGALSYISIWCEHHEDLLGQFQDGTFDSFQVKTATPENGAWEVKDDAFRKSLGRFVALDKRFPSQVKSHAFVSNVRYYDTGQGDQIHKSPIQFMKAVCKHATHSELPSPYDTVLKGLAEQMGCSEADLFSTCKKVRLVTGPRLEHFESEIAHRCLPRLPDCSSLNPAQLDALRDELIHSVYKASSISVSDPSQFWYGVSGNNGQNPRLLAKRLVVADTIDGALATHAMLFRFAPAPLGEMLREGRTQHTVLQQKFIHGGLAGQVDTMQWRTISAEQHLLSLTAKDPDEAAVVLNQVRGLVKAACSDANLAASASPEPWGPDMLRQVLRRLERVADTQQSGAAHQTLDCLVGVAGLLTEACEVWWSPTFDLETQP